MTITAQPTLHLQQGHVSGHPNETITLTILHVDGQHFYGTATVALILGVTKVRVHQIGRRRAWPQQTFRGRTFWLGSLVDEWAVLPKSKGGRPPREKEDK